MKDTFLFILFISAIVALFAFAFSFSQDQNIDSKQIFIDKKCTNCHTISSLGITSKKDDAFDLSNAGMVNDAEVMKSYLLKENKINEKEHKYKFKGTDEELNSLVEWLMTLKLEAEN